jgi:gamma-glutamyltranspeptidase/glutathione hydrolase
VERLTSREYADSQAQRLSDTAPPEVEVDLNSPPDDAGTTHISVMDRNGNSVAMSQTINTIFGSKITVPGTGIVLNNQLDDFSVGPEVPNAWEAVGGMANSIEPGKRPLSSQTPVIVLKDGIPVVVSGSPQGTKIISAVLQSLLNHVDFGMDASSAVMAPRVHHQWRPDKLQVEPEIAIDVRRNLEALGWPLADTSMIGAAQLAVFDAESCMFWGGADGRRDSGAAGANKETVTEATIDQACAVAVGKSVRAIPE